MDRIKRLSYEVLDAHKSRFGEDFVDNKKVLDQVSIIRSKGLKNEVAGYITKFIKKEIREEKIKQSRIESSRSDDQVEQGSSNEIDESATSVESLSETLADSTTYSNDNTLVIEGETTSPDDSTPVIEGETTSPDDSTPVIEGETTSPDDSTQ